MRKFAIAAAFLAFVTPALASDLAVDMEVGKTMDAVKAKMTELGYEVRKADMEDGDIEVYVVKDNKMAEVYVRQETGKITKIKGE
jgi:molybdopterin converting factor small subunit